MSSYGLDVPFWPAQASAYAAQVDWLIAGFTALVALFVVPVFVLLPYFVIKYRRGSGADRSHRRRGSLWVEVSWSVIPFGLAIGFFAWATWLYAQLGDPPADALEVSVVAKQWMWKFQHPGGQREIDVLHVPVGRPVKLVMISEDVIHSLYLPALRIKQDVLPGRYTTLWFKATKAGEYLIHCAEFCGTDHAVMGDRIVIMEPRAYQAWLKEAGADRSLAAAGEALFRKYGCSGCHGVGSSVHAPSLAGLYGSPVPLVGGGVVIADDRYIRDSILLPSSQVAAGYKPIMPTFSNILGEDDLLKLIAFIKSLDAEPGDRR